MCLREWAPCARGFRGRMLVSMFVRVEFEGDCECGEMLLVGLAASALLGIPTKSTGEWEKWQGTQ